VEHYWGFYRHHLFLGMPLLVLLVGWGLDRRIAGPASGEARRVGLALMAPWFLLQAALAVGCFALDYRYPFSDTKSAARGLPQGARVVADAEWRSMGMLFWRPDIRMRAPAWRGRPFRYSRPDREWHVREPLAPLLVEECREAPDRVYFAGVASSLEKPKARCLSRIDHPKTPLGEHPFTWEDFDVFQVDCACIGAAR
jgi:hypothetical protein